MNVYRDGGHLSVSETHEISILLRLSFSLSLAPALLSRYGGQLFTPMDHGAKEEKSFIVCHFDFIGSICDRAAVGEKKSLKPFVIGDFWGYFYYCCCSICEC